MLICTPLYTPLSTSYSMDPGDFLALSRPLDHSLCFTSRPAGAAIPLGSKLLSVRHVDIKTKLDLARVPFDFRALVASCGRSKQQSSALVAGI